MLPQYYTVVGGTPKIVLMNNNCHVFNVMIRCAAGQTVEAALEDPIDGVVNPKSPGPVWFAVTVSPLGANLYALVNPVRLIRITGAGVATVLQQGIQ
jgi:hypothetical protein